MNSKPKIQVFLPDLHDEAASEVARRMPYFKREFKVGVMTMQAKNRTKGVFADSGIPVIELEIKPLPPNDPYNCLQSAMEQLKAELPDAVIAALPDPGAAAFLIAARAVGVPLIVAEVNDQPCLFSSFEELSSLHFSDLVTPSNRILQRAFLNSITNVSDRVGGLLPHSADTTYIQLTKEDRYRYRKNLRVDPELKMITMIAPFDRRRDHDTLLEACAILKQCGHHFILLLVGDGTERRRIAEKVCVLRLEDQVTIIDDPGDHTEILCATDVFALSTHFEGNCTPLIEAMAQGLSIAATNVPGINDLIRDGRSGRLAQPKNPESFAGALVDLLAQEKTRKKVGSVARKCIENRGNLSHFLPPLIKIMKKKIHEYKEDSKVRTKIKEISKDASKYVHLQGEIRKQLNGGNKKFDISKAADLMDGFPITMQVDVLEKLCDIPIESDSLTTFVRPLEKVLSNDLFEQMPLLEMRLLEKLAAFYMDLGYVEGSEKIIENMENLASRELLQYHFSRNRFSGLRTHVRLAQLYGFIGKNEQRDHYRLEMWEYLKPKVGNENGQFHQQNAVFLEALGETKLAEREMQKDLLKVIQIAPEAPIAHRVENGTLITTKPKRRRPPVDSLVEPSDRLFSNKESLQE